MTIENLLPAEDAEALNVIIAAAGELPSVQVGLVADAAVCIRSAIPPPTYHPACSGSASVTENPLFTVGEDDKPSVAHAVTISSLLWVGVTGPGWEMPSFCWSRGELDVPE